MVGRDRASQCDMAASEAEIGGSVRGVAAPLCRMGRPPSNNSDSVNDAPADVCYRRAKGRGFVVVEQAPRVITGRSLCQGVREADGLAPVPNGFVRDGDAARREEVLDV